MTSPPLSETGRPDHIAEWDWCAKCRKRAFFCECVSETGPSPESVAREILTAWEQACHMAARGHAPIGSAEMVEIEVRLIAEALSEAKRSAHLQDARAGCPFCAGFEDYAVQPEKRDLWEGFWHRHASDAQFAKCRRPEVWDVLSLLPGGTK